MNKITVLYVGDDPETMDHLHRFSFDFNWQIHRNYIVQLTMMESLDLSTGEVFLAGDAYPIGGSYRQHLLEYLERI